MTSFESVSPLPPDIRQAIASLVAIGLVSFVTSALLFSHITYKLIAWKCRDVRTQRMQLARTVELTAHERSIDLNMGLVEAHYYQAKGKARCGRQAVHRDDALPPPPTRLDLRTATSRSREEDQEPVPSACSRTNTPPIHREKPPNPLLLLIYNLLLADITLSSAYLSGFSWLAMDGIIGGTRTCGAQGWLVSMGCLTTSGILLAISIFSYLGIIQGYKPTTRDVIIACATVWSLSIILASIGPMYLQGRDFYGRQTTWCWVSEEHKLWRLGIYLWGFPAMVATFGLYGMIFYELWREGRSSRFMPRRRGSDATQFSQMDASRGGSTALRPSGHHPAFLIYPVIYGCTGTPLIFGSLIPRLEESTLFMGIAGSLLAMTGLLDSLLWSSIILFSKREDLAITGLDEFSFVRTPEGRTLGNIVFVQGGDTGNERRANCHQSWHSKKESGWWRLGDKNSSGISIPRNWLADHERGDRGIQMEVVTSVVVETAGSGGDARNVSRPRHMSVDSMSKTS